jgi:hypothetical protein
MTKNLVPKPITDKNGVTKTHWVKPDSDAPSATRMPLPQLSPSPVAEAMRLGREISETLQQRRSSLKFNTSWTEDDYGHLRMHVAEGDHELLTVVQKLLESDSSHGPEHVGFVFRQLRRRGYEHPAELVNEETLDARESLVKALDEHGMKNGIPYFSQREGSEDVYQMAFTDTEDVPRIINIISERGMMSPEEIRTSLARMDEHPIPLQKGTL